MKGWVTINTDAGFYPIEKIGSYAYWIKADGLFLKGSGVFKDACKSPLEAEFRAIINAIHILDTSGYIGITKIVFNRDNIYTGAKKKGNFYEQMLADKIRKLRKKCNYNDPEPFYEFRHVKAHTRITAARFYVNSWCDQECKKQLREYKQKLCISKQKTGTNGTCSDTEDSHHQ